MRLHGRFGRACVPEKSLRDWGGMTISVGVVQLRPGDTVETLVEAADQALTMSKREGGNRVSKVDRP